MTSTIVVVAGLMLVGILSILVTATVNAYCHTRNLITLFRIRRRTYKLRKGLEKGKITEKEAGEEFSGISISLEKELM